MNKLKILINGYAKKTDKGWLASSTTTLIQTERHNIIVDPGINKKLLLEKLKENNLTTDDIDYVFLTHYHPDHILLAAIFEQATYFDSETIYTDDLEVDFEGVIPDTDIKVFETPGHAHEHASLILETKDLGTVVIAADVFWWMDHEDQITNDYETLINKDDPFVIDMEQLIESRKKVLEIADWVIPGHGEMFENKFKK